MPLIKLIRHAEPSALWGTHPDPGLSPLGRAQAQALADALAGEAAWTLVTSPMARCRDTIAPLETAWSRPARVEPSVSEVPTPPPEPDGDSRVWLSRLLAGGWRAAGPDIGRWRDGVAAALLSLPDHSVVCTHFVAINAAVSLALGRDAVVTFRPGHASITTLRAAQGRLELVELGAEAAISLA